MSRHPVGCGQPASLDEIVPWEHWMWDFGGAKYHCTWSLDDVRFCKEKCEASSIDGVFHKRCLQKEGFIW